MIKIISGATYIDGKLMTAESAPFSTDPDIEARLIAAGAAERVDTSVATPQNGGSEVGLGGNTPDKEKTQEPPAEGADEPALVIEDGHYTVESLMTLTRKELEEIAGNFGLDVAKCRNKGEVAAVITSVEVAEEDDSEQPPQLGAEDPQP